MAFNKQHLFEELSLENLEGVSGGVLSDRFKQELAAQYAELKKEGYTKQDILEFYARPGGINPVGVTDEDFINYVEEVWDTL